MEVLKATKSKSHRLQWEMGIQNDNPGNAKYNTKYFFADGKFLAGSEMDKLTARGLRVLRDCIVWMANRELRKMSWPIWAIGKKWHVVGRGGGE